MFEYEHNGRVGITNFKISFETNYDLPGDIRIKKMFEDTIKMFGTMVQASVCAPETIYFLQTNLESCAKMSSFFIIAVQTLLDKAKADGNNNTDVLSDSLKNFFESKRDEEND